MRRAATLAFLLLAACHRPSPETQIVFLSVGQGDCTVLRQGGDALLIDAGPRSIDLKTGASGFDAGERIVLKRLREMGVARVRAVLLTHDDLDHIGGATAILRAHPEASAWIGPDSRIPQSPRVRRMDRRQNVAFGPFRLDVLYPKGDRRHDNTLSALAAVRVEGLTLALTGDSPTGSEEAIAPLLPNGCEVYKAGHHGSAHSASPELLRVLHPSLIVVSCGAGNRYGHPAPAALARFAAIHARTLRTDQDGDVTLQLTARGWTLATAPYGTGALREAR